MPPPIPRWIAPRASPKLARRVNATGPRTWRARRRAIGARLVHLSTDFVFDGMASTPYQPDDPTNPLSVYGATKLDGEIAVRAALPHAPWCCAPRGSTTPRAATSCSPCCGSCASAARCASLPTSSARRRRRIRLPRRSGRSSRGPQSTGIHHWTDSGVASWYDFAVAIAEEWPRSAGKGSATASVIPIGTVGLPDARRSGRDSASSTRRPRAPRWD